LRVPNGRSVHSSRSIAKAIGDRLAIPRRELAAIDHAALRPVGPRRYVVLQAPRDAATGRMVLVTDLGLSKERCRAAVDVARVLRRSPRSASRSRPRRPSMRRGTGLAGSPPRGTDRRLSPWRESPSLSGFGRCTTSDPAPRRPASSGMRDALAAARPRMQAITARPASERGRSGVPASRLTRQLLFWSEGD
jgi:hypothetical protein